MPIYRFNPGGINYPLTIALIALNAAFAVADGFLGGKLSLQFGARGIDIWHGQVWRIFTCGFMHHDLLHIAANAYSLWVLGKVTEPLFGRGRFLAIYFVAMFGGAGLSIAFYDANALLVGASGAVFGLFGALLGHLYAKVGSWREVARVPYGAQLLIMLAVNAYISWKVPNVSLLGHLGGFLPGLYMGYYFTLRGSDDASIYDKLGVALTLMLVAGATAYAAMPLNRASFTAVRAMLAYEAGDIAGGDALLAEARSRRSDGDTAALLTDHLRVWRIIARDNPSAAQNLLRLPLLDPFTSQNGGSFLPLTPMLERLEAKNVPGAKPGS